jgi:hypothetical protein
MRIRIQQLNIMRIHADPDPDPKPWYLVAKILSVNLGWPIPPSNMSPILGCGVSANEYSCPHGAKITIGDLTPYLTYMYLAVSFLAGGEDSVQPDSSQPEPHSSESRRELRRKEKQFFHVHVHWLFSKYRHSQIKRNSNPSPKTRGTVLCATEELFISAVSWLAIVEKKMKRPGIRCFFDPWIRDGKKLDPDAGWTPQIIFQGAQKQFFWLKILWSGSGPPDLKLFLTDSYQICHL